MSEWSHLENQLRSWKPRRPSARLEARLFGAEEASAGDIRSRAAWHWLAPAMAMCLLAMMMVGNSYPRSPYWGSAQPSNLLAAVVLRDPDLACYYAGMHQNDRNVLPRDGFEWTNGMWALIK